MLLDLAQCSTCQLPLTILLWLATIIAGACCIAVAFYFSEWLLRNISTGDSKCKVYWMDTRQR